MEKIKSFLEQKKSEMTGLEKLLTSIPAIAPEGGGDGETKKADALEAWLKQNGFNDIQRIEAPDSRVSSGSRPSLIVTVPGQNSDYNIWVMAHIDVVPTGDLGLWHSDPWTVVEKDGKLIGRGVEDNQQGLVSSAFAALYYIQNKIAPAHTVKLLFVADEENGSTYGINYLLKNYDFFKKDDIILIPDGGDSEGRTIEIAEKNILWAKVRVTGVQTHGSRPDSGKNACLAACELSLLLHKLEKKFNKKNALFEPDYSTFQPTKCEKNVDSVNIIPGEDVFYMDCRVLPCYPLAKVTAQFEKCAQKIEKKYGVKVSFEYPQMSESPATPVDAPVVKKLSFALKKAHGIDSKCIGIGGGTVGAELRRLGYNAAVWSTLDDQAHQPDEYCKVENIVKDAVTMAVLFSE